MKFPISADHLRLLADFFDLDDRKHGNSVDEVQRDLRAMGHRLDVLETLPPIVVLCGSLRFARAWKEETRRLTLEGKIVLGVGCQGHTPEEKARLDALHFRKIDLADEVRILNVGGYIGDSTTNELMYAIASGKPVTFLEADPPL